MEENEIAERELVLQLEPTIYEDITELEKQHSEVSTWLSQNENTEDEKVAALIFVNKNKYSRLSRELDKLSDRLRVIENEAEKFRKRHKEVIDAKVAIADMKKILSAVKQVDIKYDWVLPSKPQFVLQIEAELLKNETVVSKFMELVDSSDFKIAA